MKERPKTRFETAAGRWTLFEDETTCDCAWKLQPRENGTRKQRAGGWRGAVGGDFAFPATWENLLLLKNAVQEHDAGSTIFPTAGGESGTQHAGNRCAIHHPALARGRVGDARAQSRRHGQSEQHSPRAGIRRRRDARRAARYCAVSLHRHERPGRASGTKRRRHEPRLRALEAQDRVSPPAHRVELQRRSSAHWRQIRRAGGRARARVRARQLHHVRSVARAGADAARRPTPLHG